MSRNKIIKVRVSEKEHARIEEAAQKRGESMSEYVRSCLDRNLTKKWIRKTKIQPFLSHIAGKLDRCEEKNAGLVQSIRKEMEELWEML
ncbi:MAG: hypothetical protein K1W28_12765 [Lachnospiraceae bacterium]